MCALLCEYKVCSPLRARVCSRTCVCAPSSTKVSCRRRAPNTNSYSESRVTTSNLCSRPRCLKPTVHTERRASEKESCCRCFKSLFTASLSVVNNHRPVQAESRVELQHETGRSRKNRWLETFCTVRLYLRTVGEQQYEGK